MTTTAQPNIRQDLLYIQTSSTALTSNIHGMSLQEDGEIIDPELPFLYHTPLDMIRDGWRVIQFPNTCLLYTSPSPRDATLSRMPSSA